MKTVLSNRIAVLVVALVGVVALFLAARTFLLSSEDETSTAPAVPTTPRPSADVTTEPGTSGKPTTPKLVLLPGLPRQVDHALRSSRVVVVSLYAGASPSDRAAVARTRRAARIAGAGFVAINAFDEKNAKSLPAFAGTTSVPAVLVVRRPGNILKRFEGFADPAITVQAARNAGAGRR